MKKLLLLLGTIIIVGSGVANATANSNLLVGKTLLIINYQLYFLKTLLYMTKFFLFRILRLTINMSLYYCGEEVRGFLRSATKSVNVVYRVWNSLKVSPFDVTNKDFY